jgi:hypothetical protein
MSCHDDLDKDPGKTLEKKVAWFLDSRGNPAWSDFTRQPAGINFAHGPHTQAKVACTECHLAIDKNTGLQPGWFQRMNSCMECHAARAISKTDCWTCHSSIDRMTPPANHRQLWTKLHGAASRDGERIATANQCALCHRNDACITCHSTRPPEDHTDFWRIKAHGLAVQIDRSRCQTCHSSDFCVRCHQQMSPSSHVAGWNAPRDRHCTSCHLPLGSSGGCAVCHRSAPGHDLAPPKPVWHTPAMVCRSCHGVTLKHPDNGDNCNACHR